MQPWILKPCSDINRMLKVRNDLESFEPSLYPLHISIIHRYATSDDLIFPEPTTLAFFGGFQEECLEQLDDALFVAQDIDTGLLTIHIYAKDHNKTITDTIAYLKRQPKYHVEFKVTTDPQWKIIAKLGEE